MRGLFKVAACAALVASLSVVVPGPGPDAVARERYVIRSTRLVPGLRYVRMTDRVGPKRIKILKVNPDVLTLDVELARDKLPGRETTSSMAERRGAVAAVNGTFGLPWGRPVGLFAEDSVLQTSPMVRGNAFGMTADQTSKFIGHPDLVVSIDGGAAVPNFNAAQWNVSEPHPERVSGYTPAGGRFAKPPPNACQARLFETGVPAWSASNGGVGRTYDVDEVRCADEAMGRRGGIVLSAPPATRAARRVMALESTEVVHLTWSLGWSGVIDAIAGNPVLVENGVNLGYDCTTYFCRANPRTGVGVTPTGRILLVTVDGRQPGYSVGMTLREFADLFMKLNATTALNLDGGGSSTTVIRRPKDGMLEMVNRPSDPAGERDVSSAILVLEADDPDEPVLASGPPTTSATASRSAEVLIGAGSLLDPSATDAGSTGGLLDALDKGALGRRRIDLPPALDSIDALFDARPSGL